MKIVSKEAKASGIAGYQDLKGVSNYSANFWGDLVILQAH